MNLIDVELHVVHRLMAVAEANPSDSYIPSRLIYAGMPQIWFKLICITFDANQDSQIVDKKHAHFLNGHYQGFPLRQICSGGTPDPLMNETRLPCQLESGLCGAVQADVQVLHRARIMNPSGRESSFHASPFSCVLVGRFGLLCEAFV